MAAFFFQQEIILGLIADEQQNFLRQQGVGLGRALQPGTVLAAPAQFDLAVSNAPAAQVFMALVSGTRYSMLVAPEVAGNVTVNLKSVTVREALETLRDLYGYEFRFQGTRIHIQPNTMQTRLFQINYLANKRQGQSDVRVISSSISASTSNPTPPGAPAVPGVPAGSGATSTTSLPSSQISTTQTADFWRDLAQALGTIVGTQDGRAVVLNPASGVVMVKAMPGELRAVEDYLRMTQLIAERQVMLEAKIIQVQLNEQFQAGVNWNYFGGGDNRFSVGVMQPGVGLNTGGKANSASTSNGGVVGPGVGILPGAGGAAAATKLGSGFFGLAFQSANFAALLNFLETQGNVQVLSSPRIASVNNQKAVLKVGTDEFYVTNVSSTTTTTGASNVTTPTITLQPFFSGIALDITPQIDGENNIVLHVHPSISVVTEKQKVIDLGTLGQFTLPLANSTVNETDSVVRVQDGNIVAIGGLMKQEQGVSSNGLPGTTGSGGLGLLFGGRSNYSTKSELVILIKPTIIRNESSWKDDLVETQQRLLNFDPRRALPPRP